MNYFKPIVAMTLAMFALSYVLPTYSQISTTTAASAASDAASTTATAASSAASAASTPAKVTITAGKMPTCWPMLNGGYYKITTGSISGVGKWMAWVCQNGSTGAVWATTDWINNNANFKSWMSTAATYGDAQRQWKAYVTDPGTSTATAQLKAAAEAWLTANPR